MILSRFFHRFLLSLLICIFVLPLFSVVAVNSQNSSSVPYPTIDGHWSPGEWPSSIIQTYDFNRVGGLTVQFGYRINATDIFMTARYQDFTPSFYNGKCYSQIYKVCSDAFAVGFDNNGDQVYMGTQSSPDDAIFIGIEGNYSIDTYMQGISNRIVYDTEVGGVNNTFGRYSYDNTTHYFTFEMVKALKSNDTLGNDIELNKGDQIHIMLAFWDHHPPRTDKTGLTNWIRITIRDPTLMNFDLISFLIPLIIALGVIVVLAFVPILTGRRK